VSEFSFCVEYVKFVVLFTENILNNTWTNNSSSSYWLICFYFVDCQSISEIVISTNIVLKRFLKEFLLLFPILFKISFDVSMTVWPFAHSRISFDHKSIFAIETFDKIFGRWLRNLWNVAWQKCANTWVRDHVLFKRGKILVNWFLFEAERGCDVANSSNYHLVNLWETIEFARASHICDYSIVKEDFNTIIC
jgi:hypothetical protein